MPIPRTVMVDDDGSGLTGTILNNAWKQELYNQIDAAALTTTYGSYIDLGTISGVNHNFNPVGSADKVFWYLFASAGTELTGLQTAPPGTVHVIFNHGNPLIFRHLNSGSALANQFIGPGYADYTLPAWYAIQLVKSHIHNGWLILKAS